MIESTEINRLLLRGWLIAPILYGSRKVIVGVLDKLVIVVSTDSDETTHWEFVRQCEEYYEMPIAPFRPFDQDQVRQVVGCPQVMVDRTWKELPLSMGEDKTQGLNYVQLFAVYVEWRYREEGAKSDRAKATRDLVCGMSYDILLHVVTEKKDESFPAPTIVTGLRHNTVVRNPDSRLGRTLNLHVLYAAFLDRLEKVFPPEKK